MAAVCNCEDETQHNFTTNDSMEEWLCPEHGPIFRGSEEDMAKSFGEFHTVEEWITIKGWTGEEAEEFRRDHAEWLPKAERDRLGV